MKTRWLLGIVVLSAAILACAMVENIPFRIDFDPELRIEYYSVDVINMAVTPPSGSGSFTLLVQYDSMGEFEGSTTHYFPGWVTCNYTTPDGASFLIGEIHPPNESKKGVIQIANLPFSVNDSVKEDGIYTATCTNHTLTSSANTTFTVTGNDTPTPEPPSQPAATPTATLQIATLKGRIVFDYNTYQSTRPSGGGELDRVTKWCIPEVTITLDGVVGGTCEFFGTADVHESTVTALVTGIAVQGGSFNFTYVVTEKGSNGWNLKPGENPSVPVWSNEAKWEISYTGSGNFTSATQASGTAAFDFSCDSGADNLFWCNSQPREAFSGTVVWSFVPMP